MRPFAMTPGRDAAGAVRAAGSVNAAFLAGGTTLIDLMKLDVMRPEVLVDINPLQAGMGSIEATPQGLRLGALARMADVADHPAVRRDYPVVAESLQLAASGQLRNMASMAGNLLQRSRCSYFRDTSYEACNKRSTGSGCAALGGVNRIHAVLGTTDQCISAYPGDFAQAMVALEGHVETLGPAGARAIPLSRLHVQRADAPHVETTLLPGELITALVIPAGAHTRRSTYVKVRDRQSYAFAIASAAVALDLADDGTVREARIGLGGIHYAPYRATAAEAVLKGRLVDESSARAAADAALQGAVTHGHNDYKPELARRTLVRALLQARDMRI